VFSGVRDNYLKYSASLIEREEVEQTFYCSLTMLELNKNQLTKLLKRIRPGLV